MHARAVKCIVHAWKWSDNAVSIQHSSRIHVFYVLMQGKPYGPKTDVWALGCILYELCSLRKAFNASNLGAVTIKILRRGARLHANTIRCTGWPLHSRADHCDRGLFSGQHMP